jgi:hypothetical protein
MVVAVTAAWLVAIPEICNKTKPEDPPGYCGGGATATCSDQSQNNCGRFQLTDRGQIPEECEAGANNDHCKNGTEDEMCYGVLNCKWEPTQGCIVESYVIFEIKPKVNSTNCTPQPEGGNPNQP